LVLKDRSKEILMHFPKPDEETTYKQADQVYREVNGLFQGPFVVESDPPYAVGRSGGRMIPLLNPTTGESVGLVNSLDLINAEDYMKHGPLVPT
jgi:hypothetical protein